MKNPPNAGCARRPRQSVGIARCCANASSARATDCEPYWSALRRGTRGVQNQLPLRALGARSAEESQERGKTEAAAGKSRITRRHELDTGDRDRREGSARELVLAGNSFTRAPLGLSSRNDGS